MKHWFCKNFGDPLLAGDALEQVKDFFQQAYPLPTQTPEVAIFIRHESEAHLHCEVTLYFSPAAADVAQAFGATHCHKPASHDLGLFAGSEAAWSLLDDLK